MTDRHDRFAGWRRLLACAGLLCAVQAQAGNAELDEIARILNRQLWQPPEALSLQTLQALADKQPVTASAINDALAQLDPHARYFPRDAFLSRTDSLLSRTGVGIQLVPTLEGIRLDVLQGGPAQQAGVSAMALLLAVNGQSVKGMAAEKVASLFGGNPGSSISLDYQTADGRWQSKKLVRQQFTPLLVEHRKQAGYNVLRIRFFLASSTRAALQATLQRLPQKGTEDGRPLVLDLRGNPGGDLYEALDLAGDFLPGDSLLASLQARHGEPRTLKSSGGLWPKLPLAILVDGDSASAAEIFAGILQAHGRAQLVGSITHGKCSSQADTRLTSGAVLRYTNLDVKLPNGQSCSGRGLIPDLAARKGSEHNLTVLLQLLSAQNL